MPTRKKRRHRKRKTYKRGGMILKAIRTTQPDGYADSKIMPSSNNKALFDKDKFVPSVNTPWLLRFNEAKYANRILFGKYNGEPTSKSGTVHLVLNNAMEEEQANLYNELDNELKLVELKLVELKKTFAKKEAAEKAANEAAEKAANEAARNKEEEEEEEAEEAYKAAEAAYKAARKAEEAYSNSFNTFLSKYFPSPGLKGGAPVVSVTSGEPKSEEPTSEKPTSEEIQIDFNRETLWPKEQITHLFYSPTTFSSIFSTKFNKEIIVNNSINNDNINELRMLMYKHRASVYDLIDDKMVEKLMDSVDNDNTKYSSIYKKGDTTTYNNIRYVIMWILFKIDIISSKKRVSNLNAPSTNRTS